MFRVAIFGQYVPFFARSIFDIPNVTYLSTLRGGEKIERGGAGGRTRYSKTKDSISHVVLCFGPNSRYSVFVGLFTPVSTRSK